MRNIDKQALRQLAVDAKELAIIKRYTKGIEAQKKFIAVMTPATVLALLDELEKEKGYASAFEAEKWHYHGLAESEGERADRAEKRAEVAEKRNAELEASHSKLRDTMAGIHNTIRMDGGYTPLAAILNAAKRAYEDSATAAGISKGE